MSIENINKLTNYAKTIGFRFYDIGEQVYNGTPETVLTVYLDKEHTQELEHHVYKDWGANNAANRINWHNQQSIL